MTAVAITLVTTACALGPAAPGAAALDTQPLCTAAGLFSGLAGKACTVVTNVPKIAKAGKKALSGHLGSAAKTLLGDGGSTTSTTSTASTASTALGLAAIGAWVLGGATVALHETAKVLSDTTSPQLQSTWFSATYWRIAAIAAVLTLPFLFAAAVQALLHSDLALLIRAALGYLPLSLLAVSIAAPVTMLLLSASDQMSAIVGSAAGDAGTDFLIKSGVALGALTVLSGSPFLAFLVGLLTAAGALTLWLELMMREAAVYVIVLMLPLVFAAFVWPARRVWAVRAVELLVALILSKFAIVAVLALGGEALSHSAGHSITDSLAGVVLLMMGAFAPWALLRLVPLAELASGAAGSLRAEARAAKVAATTAGDAAAGADALWNDGWAGDLTNVMRRQADATPSASGSGYDAGVDRRQLTDLATSATAGSEPPDDGIDPFGDGSGGGLGDGDPGGGKPGDGGPPGGGSAGGVTAGGGSAADSSAQGGSAGAATFGGGSAADSSGDGGSDRGVDPARTAPGDDELGGDVEAGRGDFRPIAGDPGAGAADGRTATSGGSGAGGQASAGTYDEHGAARRERFRDWGEMWQARDEEWRPLVYPFDRDDPPQPPWPPDDGADTGHSVRSAQELPRPSAEHDPEDGWL